jgi:hypothetical protein
VTKNEPTTEETGQQASREVQAAPGQALDPRTARGIRRALRDVKRPQDAPGFQSSI